MGPVILALQGIAGNQWNTAFWRAGISIRVKGRKGDENLESTHPQSFLRKSPGMQWLVGEQNEKPLQVLQK